MEMFPVRSPEIPCQKFEKMITLYTALSLWELPSISPACMELETWFRMAKLPYNTVIVTADNLKLAPKGKVPFIDYQGKLVSDATLIIEMLKQKQAIDLDGGLTDVERAISLAFRRTIKENTFWGIPYIRYNIQENWQHFRAVLAHTLFPETPIESSQLFAEEFRKTVLSQMHGHGMGRHSSEEIIQIICTDFQALCDFLADKPFFMGEQPTTLDATTYAYIGNFIKPPYGSPIVDYVLQRANLCQHYERMTKQFFSERFLNQSIPVHS
ncbi:glutathione S-transferase family protein [Nostoc sp. PA-18-2419]|uniref:glutathione S-transferase family protein n=1 Tax=Nostoc sp. PA-18-2419 TaxID=2575443 RepID=UPI0011095391|nr:glutathione S-transferase family protein [Nostoc sp. PA-18-2419]